MVLGAYLPGHFTGVGELAEGLLLIADRESLDRPGGHGLHKRGDGARIDTARQEHAERHVAHETSADGFFQTGAAFRNPGLVVALFIGDRAGTVSYTHLTLPTNR